MNKPNSPTSQRRLLAVLAGVGVVLGLSVSAFIANINGNDKTIAAEAPRQTIEVNTSAQAPVTEATEPAVDTATPTPTSTKDGNTVSRVKAAPTTQSTQTIVDSSTRVKVTPKPVATTPSQGSTQVQPAPKTVSPTEGYIRPQVSFLGVTSCKAISEGWQITISWKVSGGNFIGRFNGQNSGLQGTGDSWVIRMDEEFMSTDAPTGSYTFRTEGNILEFVGMNGENEVIDYIRFANSVNADLTGKCR